MDKLVLHDENNEVFVITPKYLFNAALTGRDEKKVKEYIENLKKQGGNPSKEAPTFFKKSPYLIDTNEKLFVLDKNNSVEAEVVIIINEDNEIYITCGIDVFDKEIQLIETLKSKHIYPNHISSYVWKYELCKQHWDEIILRSWIGSNDKRLYQETKLSYFLSPESILKKIRNKYGNNIIKEPFILFCGTCPYKIDGLPWIETFYVGLIDEHLKRTITCRMKQEIL